ncbi:hypothetical protein B566_EDAN008725 [Ephemera danica]|nr:hypothetical protein B566_EDAN008725 [Ephemera danica]
MQAFMHDVAVAKKYRKGIISRPAECFETPAVAGLCKARTERYSYHNVNISRPAECYETSGVVGPCDAIMERYTFDDKTKHCKPFHYGGCGGTKNNFKNLDECNCKCKAKKNKQ